MATTVSDSSRASEQARPGMGALPHPDGVAFRVWAPHADFVAVAGTFNNWSPQQHPLRQEEGGTWYVDVPEARVGDEYRYFLRNGERELWRIDPYAREVTNSIGNAVVSDTQFDWEGDDFRLPPLNELVIYELHAGTFNSDPENLPGGLLSVADRLAHLKHLGVNVIQIMPTAEFAGDLSWGYNPAHIFAVESSYGGPQALKTLVRAAHQVGIGVILDVVYNHFGPSDLDSGLWQFDGWSENDRGGIYFYNDWRAETPWGSTRPDYGRGEVRQYLRDNALMWLEEFHMDGLRYDMTLFIRSVRGHDELPEGWSLTQWMNGEIRERFPQCVTIAEDLQNNAWLTKPPGEGGAGFHTQWDASFVHPIRAAITTGRDQHRSMHAVRDALVANYNGDPFQRVIYSESHDEVANGKQRVPSEIAPRDPAGFFAQKRSTLAAALVFTAPGVPMLFQGQEFLEEGWFRDDVPLDWHRCEEFSGIVRLYRDLIHLRLNRGGNTRGLCGRGIRLIRVDDTNNVVAFQRWDSHGLGDDVVVIANLSNRLMDPFQLGFPCEGPWRLRLNTDSRLYSPHFGDQPSQDVHAEPGEYDGLAAHAPVCMAPYSALIYSQDP